MATGGASNSTTMAGDSTTPLNESLKEIAGLITHLEKENKSERVAFQDSICQLSQSIVDKSEATSLVQATALPEFSVLASLKDCSVFTTMELEHFLRQVEKLYVAMEVRGTEPVLGPVLCSWDAAVLALRSAGGTAGGCVPGRGR